MYGIWHSHSCTAEAVGILGCKDASLSECFRCFDTWQELYLQERVYWIDFLSKLAECHTKDVFSVDVCSTLLVVTNVGMVGEAFLCISSSQVSTNILSTCKQYQCPDYLLAAGNVLQCFASSQNISPARTTFIPSTTMNNHETDRMCLVAHAQCVFSSSWQVIWSICCINCLCLLTLLRLGAPWCSQLGTR